MASMALAHAAPRSQAVVPPLGGPDKNYRFPTETDSEVISILNMMGLYDVHEHDLQRPNQQVAMACFSAFNVHLNYVSDEIMDGIKMDCLDKLDYKELYDESLHFLVRFIEIRALMIAACILDFNITDITHPKPKRFKRQLFALINFLRFSEELLLRFDQIKEDKDKIFQEKEKLREKVAKMEEDLQQQEETRQSQERATLRLHEINVKLTEKLNGIQKEQDMLRNRYAERKAQHTEAKSKYDNLKRECDLLNGEVERLQMRIDDNPTQLRDMNENQRRRLREKEQASQEEESKSQSMAHKRRVLEGLETDIGMCAQLVKSCIEENARMKREQGELDKLRKDRSEMAEEREKLNLQLEQARQRHQYALERLDKAQRNLETKRDENKRSVESSNERWQEAQQVKRERSEKADVINRELARIEAEYEKITRSFDAFYADLSQQKDQLERQTRNYMQAIAQRMDLQVDIL